MKFKPTILFPIAITAVLAVAGMRLAGRSIWTKVRGLEGLRAAGMLALVVMGVTLMAARRRSLWGILGALPGFLAFRTADGEIPAGSEMPAAAALGVAGILMEVTILW
jgi:hypothetical protein